MAAIGVFGELDFVNRHEGDGVMDGHGLDGADKIAGGFRPDPLFARNQCRGAFAFEGDDLVVDFAGQQAKRQADHAGTMAKHALDGIVGFTGIGRPEHGL